MRLESIVAVTVAIALGFASAASAATVRSRGKLQVDASAGLVAVSTDPTIQHVLNDDFYANGRAAKASAKVTTVTVTLAQRALNPGVSLEQLAPGDPGVVALLRAAGAVAPPVGNAGSAQPDPYGDIARLQVMQPDNPAVQLRQDQAFQQAIGMPGAGGPSLAQPSDGGNYDMVIIARATVDNRPDQFTAVALAHPGDDLRAVKKLLAEEIANAALH